MSKLYFCPSLFDLIEKEFVRRRSYDMQYLHHASMDNANSHGLCQHPVRSWDWYDLLYPWSWKVPF